MGQHLQEYILVRHLAQQQPVLTALAASLRGPMLVELRWLGSTLLVLKQLLLS
jgi:hypothetical protein